MSKIPQPRSSSPPATTTAPAPSPKITAVPRSPLSVIRDSASAPTTSTTFARPGLRGRGGVVKRLEKPRAGGLAVASPRLARADAPRDLGGEAGGEAVRR